MRPFSQSFVFIGEAKFTRGGFLVGALVIWGTILPDEWKILFALAMLPIIIWAVFGYYAEFWPVVDAFEKKWRKVALVITGLLSIVGFGVGSLYERSDKPQSFDSKDYGLRAMLEQKERTQPLVSLKANAWFKMNVQPTIKEAVQIGPSRWAFGPQPMFPRLIMWQAMNNDGSPKGIGLNLECMGGQWFAEENGYGVVINFSHSDVVPGITFSAGVKTMADMDSLKEVHVDIGNQPTNFNVFGGILVVNANEAKPIRFKLPEQRDVLRNIRASKEP